MVEPFSTRLSLSLARKGGFIVGAGARGSGRWRGWGGAAEGTAAWENNKRGDGESWDFSPAGAFAVRHDGSSRPACRRLEHFFPPDS